MIGCVAESLTEDIRIDATELEDARWFSRDDVIRMMGRTDPSGLVVPPSMAIAHGLLRVFVDGDG